MPRLPVIPRRRNRRPCGAAALRAGRASDPICLGWSAFLPADGSETSVVGDDATQSNSGRDERPVTHLLRRIRDGDRGAADGLARLVYDELKQIAVRAGARLPKSPMDATEVTHEAWLRLFGHEPPTFADRRHLFSAAARAMRHVLIDSVRADGRQRPDGDGRHVAFDDHVGRLTRRVRDPIALDDELKKLAQIDPVLEELVNLRFLLGLTMEQCADLLDVPLRTLERHWQFVKSWLEQQVQP